jgi:hypothetical protein
VGSDPLKEQGRPKVATTSWLIALVTLRKVPRSIHSNFSFGNISRQIKTYLSASADEISNLDKNDLSYNF